MRSRGWYVTTEETVHPGCDPGTVRRWWDGHRWTEHFREIDDLSTDPPVDLGGGRSRPGPTEVVRLPETKGF